MTCSFDVLRQQKHEMRGVHGGLLVQGVDRSMEDPAQGRVVTKRHPTPDELRAMAFGLRVVKGAKSNAVVFCNPEQILAIGSGGTSRVDPIRDAAIPRAQRLDINLDGSIAASEAFFPFPDGIRYIGDAGATAIIQPGGSKNDDQAIAMADRYNMAMVFTGVRHFKH